MHSPKKKYALIRLSIAAITLLATLHTLSFQTNAQTASRNRANEDNKPYTLPPYKPFDVTKDGYTKYRDGCGKKAATFVAMAQRYREGKSVQDVADVKIIEPLIQDIYDTIRKKGFEKAMLDNLKQYQSCAATAPPHPNPSREYDLALTHNACVKLSKVITDTLEAIKKRQKIDTVIRKYERTPINMEGTAYEDVPNPQILFIAALYKTAKTKPYENVMEQGASLSTACYM